MAAAERPLAEVAADKEHAWEALRALWGVGEPEDIEAVQRYARGVPGMPERLQEQAMLTLQAIQARQARASARNFPEFGLPIAAITGMKPFLAEFSIVMLMIGSPAVLTSFG